MRASVELPAANILVYFKLGTFSCILSSEIGAGDNDFHYCEVRKIFKMKSDLYLLLG